MLRTEIAALLNRQISFHIHKMVGTVNTPIWVQNSGSSMLPEGIEAVHPKYAIVWRNRWMLQRADYVIAYVTHPWGGAARFAEEGKTQGKRVINLP